MNYWFFKIHLNLDFNNINYTTFKTLLMQDYLDYLNKLSRMIEGDKSISIHDTLKSGLKFITQEVIKEKKAQAEAKRQDEIEKSKIKKMEEEKKRELEEVRIVVKDSIIKDQLKIAFKKFKNFYIKIHTSIPDEITLYESRYKSLQDAYRHGLIKDSDYQVELNKVKSALLKFASNITLE